MSYSLSVVKNSMLFCFCALVSLPIGDSAFLPTFPPGKLPFFRIGSNNYVSSTQWPLHMSSFVSDGSEYSSKKSDYVTDDDEDVGDRVARGYREGVDAPTIEMKPVPMSKNSGNRFVAFCWDKALDTKDRKVWKLFYDRQELTEEHVMFCRKANLYNDTFNTESMVDVLWSYPILSVDLARVIGHAMCMESTKLEYVHELMSREPIIQSLTGGDISNVPLYRWRHIRDYTLRQDDGRTGTPALLLALDHSGEEMNEAKEVREDLKDAHLEYLIRSERVIAAGPIHLPTEFKDDPSSLAVGSLVLYNAQNRTDAVDFAENDPYALAGLYGNMRVHFYNNLDVTGKFVSENELTRDHPCAQMKEAMEVWGYPVDDMQTPWLNW